MPLQNRVDPFGDIHAAPYRGLFTGNRGSIHDPETRTLTSRRWTTKAWLICECAFEGRRRDVMGRNAPSGRPGWTELFFLDEVTALAAGHRPCFYCRRERAKEFAARFGEASGGPTAKAREMDRQLHHERLACGGSAGLMHAAAIAELPDGAMISVADQAFATCSGRLLAWSFGGYAAAARADLTEPVRLITPTSTVAALRAGYRPMWHASALDGDSGPAH